MQSPLLPWEVIERVIGHSGDHPETLYSFSLTCRQLRPRALCLMVADINFNTRDQIFGFCGFLEDKPYLKPLVRSIAVHPADFAPFPLLHILPKLSKISFDSQCHPSRDDYSFKAGDAAGDGLPSEDSNCVERFVGVRDSSQVGEPAEDGDFVGDDDSSEDGDFPEEESVGVGDSSQDGSVFQIRYFVEDDNGHHSQNHSPIDSFPLVALNQSTLTCCQRFGTRVQTLHLSNLSFSTYLDFARVLLAFTSMTHLACVNTVISAEGNRALLDVMEQRLSERLHLLTIDIDFLRLDYNTPSVAALLLDLGLVQSTVETLTVHNPYRSNGLSHPVPWPHLRSLVLKLEFTIGHITDAIAFLEGFPPSVLKDVVAELRSQSILDVHDALSGEVISEWFKELEQNLLRFPRPQIVFSVDRLCDGDIPFWTQEIGKHFPVLLQRGAFKFTLLLNTGALHGLSLYILAGDLATSPDGKWVATSSRDSTIIIWDTADGTIRWRWIPHGYSFLGLSSLAFSPDSQYLLSGSGDSKVKIWDLAEGSRLVATLEGHTSAVTGCAWSPHGDIVASMSHDSTIRLWDAHTFRELHVLLDHENEGGIIDFIAFSPDGRWLASGSHLEYRIWNVASGTLHKSFPNEGMFGTAAAFDPGSTRLLLQSHVVKLVDVKTGQYLSTLTDVDRISTRASHIVFSPDGALVSTASDSSRTLNRHGTVKLWDAHTYNKRFSLEGHEDTVTWTCFSPCGKYVASASHDCTVRLWRTRNGSCRATFSEHATFVCRVAFSGDGQTLWSMDRDGTVIMRRMCDVLPMDE